MPAKNAAVAQLQHDSKFAKAEMSAATEQARSADRADNTVMSACREGFKITANTACRLSAVWGSVQVCAADLVPLLAVASVVRKV
jgi:hypothetical protein